MAQKLTKERIEEFANELYSWLVSKELNHDVCIYYNGKRINNCYESGVGYQVRTENGYNPYDYFEYVNPEHILSMSFEGPLYDVINYRPWSILDEFESIFEKYGCYYELGHAWNLSAYPNDDDMEIEFTPIKMRPDPEHIYRHKGNVIPELQTIMDEWYKMSSEYGDIGSCVIGAGFEFTYKGNSYFMSPCSPYQGSCSWESGVNYVRKSLESIGATDIHYNYGCLD